MMPKIGSIWVTMMFLNSDPHHWILYIQFVSTLTKGQHSHWWSHVNWQDSPQLFYDGSIKKSLKCYLGIIKNVQGWVWMNIYVSWILLLNYLLFYFILSFYLPDKYTDIILRIPVGRNRRDACSHCYFTVDLDEAWAKEIVATCGLVCITLK